MELGIFPVSRPATLGMAVVLEVCTLCRSLGRIPFKKEAVSGASCTSARSPPMAMTTMFGGCGVEQASPKTIAMIHNKFTLPVLMSNYRSLCVCPPILMSHLFEDICIAWVVFITCRTARQWSSERSVQRNHRIVKNTPVFIRKMSRSEAEDQFVSSTFRRDLLRIDSR